MTNNSFASMFRPLILAVVYFVAATLSLSLASAHTNVSPVWPPTGIAIASVLLLGYRVWPAIFAGAFLANLWTGVSVATAGGIAIGNTTEALLAAFLLHYVGFRNYFESARDVFKFALIGGLLSTAVSATVGNLSLCLGGAAKCEDFGSLWFTWWLGDAVGALVVAPLLVSWGAKSGRHWGTTQYAEAVLLLLLLSLVAMMIFGGWFPTHVKDYPLGHLTYPFLIWAAFRLGRRGVTLAIAVMSAVTIWGTAHGFGPFVRETPNESLLLLQAFVGSSAVMFMILVGIVEERRRSEGALRESEERYSALAEAVPEILFTNLPDGSCDYANQRFYDYTGLSSGSANGFRWAAALHPDDMERSIARWRDSIETGRPFEIECRFRRADGEYRWFRSHSVPVRDIDGRTVKWFGVCMDVDNEKRAEEERARLLASEQDARRSAETAGRLKDEFLATVSHELRTPLTSILGWAGMLRSGSVDGDTAAHAVEVIERNAKSQQRLIEDLLDMSRIITGTLQLDIRPVDLTSVIREAADTVRPAAEVKGIRLELGFRPEPHIIPADPARLQQVVWNLLSNAVKFTPAGGRVNVRIERSDSHVEIAVADTGEGINPEFLPIIFDRFRQADSSTTRRHGGLGLGLAIVRQLVELHGGTVGVESRGLGHGATFTIRLPLDPAWRVEPDGDRSREAQGMPRRGALEGLVKLDGRRVLIVDDESDTLVMLGTFLRERGAEVRASTSARDAFALLKEWKPDVMISDIGMPDEDGYALIRKVRELGYDQGGHTPAIALSGYAGPEDRSRALGAGFQMHLAKPVELVEITSAVASLCRHDHGDRDT